jgi:hypothetical protein
VPGSECRAASRSGATTLCGTEREREVSSHLIGFLVWIFMNIERGDAETVLLLVGFIGWSALADADTALLKVCRKILELGYWTLVPYEVAFKMVANLKVGVASFVAVCFGFRQ